MSDPRIRPLEVDKVKVDKKRRELLESIEVALANEQSALAVVKLRKKAIQDRIEKLLKQRVENCPHNEQDEHSSYFSGSYDEVARTYYSIKCHTCGETLKSWDKAHNYYG